MIPRYIVQNSQRISGLFETHRCKNFLSYDLRKINMITLTRRQKFTFISSNKSATTLEDSNRNFKEIV